jgi:hypothetical protein
MYPSGLWRGYWEQPIFGRQPMHDLMLSFSNGTISGQGRDVIGRFTFSGTYDTQGNVQMTKQYLGRHQVLYVGHYDGEGTIFGNWSIVFSRGPFVLSLADHSVAEHAVIQDIVPAD